MVAAMKQALRLAGLSMIQSGNGVAKFQQLFHASFVQMVGQCFLQPVEQLWLEQAGYRAVDGFFQLHTLTMTVQAASQNKSHFSIIFYTCGSSRIPICTM